MVMLAKGATKEQYEACRLMTVTDQLKLSSLVNTAIDDNESGCTITAVKPKKPLKAQMKDISEIEESTRPSEYCTVCTVLILLTGNYLHNRFHLLYIKAKATLVQHTSSATCKTLLHMTIFHATHKFCTCYMSPWLKASISYSNLTLSIILIPLSPLNQFRGDFLQESSLLDIFGNFVYICLVRRKANRAATIKRWPGNDIPNFKKKVACDKLNQLVEELLEDCCFEPLKFGRDGIRQHVFNHISLASNIIVSVCRLCEGRTSQDRHCFTAHWYFCCPAIEQSIKM